MHKKQNPTGVIPVGQRSCQIGPGIWMLLPFDIRPEVKAERINNYLNKANKEPVMFNPKRKI